MRAAVIVGFAAVLAAAPASAQRPDASLDRVVAHLDAANFDSARAELDRWQVERATSAALAERASADVLAARLERDGSTAREAWLSVALAHPFSADAGLALLRVGQAAVLAGDTTTALVYLNRLVDDFPGSGHRAEAHLWISRAEMIARRHTRACASARSGLAGATSAEVAGLLRLQEDRACAAAAAQPPAAPPAASRPTPAQPSVSTPPAATPPANAGTGRFAVQSGAFRTRASADALMERLRAAGLQPRLVLVPTNDLMRVRVGTFASQAEANQLRDTLRSDGFDAVVVNDARSETPVP